MEYLNMYLQIAPDLVPKHDDNLTRPSIRHPDLQPNNVIVSPDLEVTGLIDWQHCAILPLFLQAGIPGSLQNYGDAVSESLETPRLPADFDEQDEAEQLKQVLVLRKRQLHYTYVKETTRLCPSHGKALVDHPCILRRKLFRHASEPWEGDSVALKTDSVELTKQWPTLVASTPYSWQPNKCPIEFSTQEASEILRLAAAMEAADSTFQSCLEIVGVGPEGWVPAEQHAEARQREQKLKADTLEDAESDEERGQMVKHWIFGDFDETEYL
jgi:hypothetical protein